MGKPVVHFELYGPNPSELQSVLCERVRVGDPCRQLDLQATLDKVESLGGKTVTPVTEIPGVVTFAEFQDPQGRVVGLALP
jgi:hypothetical protein